MLKKGIFFITLLICLQQSDLTFVVVRWVDVLLHQAASHMILYFWIG